MKQFYLHRLILIDQINHRQLILALGIYAFFSVLQKSICFVQEIPLPNVNLVFVQSHLLDYQMRIKIK